MVLREDIIHTYKNMLLKPVAHTTRWRYYSFHQRLRLFPTYTARHVDSNISFTWETHIIVFLRERFRRIRRDYR